MTARPNSEVARRPLWRILRWLGALVLVLVLALCWLLMTQSGLRTALKFVPDGFRFEQARGSALGGVQLQNVRFTAGAAQVSIAQLSTNIRWTSLWQKVLHIRTLDARDVRITQVAQSEQPASEATTDTRWQIQLDALQIDSLQYFQASDTNALIDVLRLRGSAITLADQRLGIGSLSVAERRAQIDSSGVLDLDVKRPGQSELKLSAKATQELLDEIGWTQPIALDAMLSGDQKTLQLSASMSAPTAFQLDATVREPLGKLTWVATLRTESIDASLFAPKLPISLVQIDWKGSGEQDAIELSGMLALDSNTFTLKRIALKRDTDTGQLQIPAFSVGLPNGGELNAKGQWPIADLQRQPSAQTQATQQTANAPGSRGELQLSWTDFALPARLQWPAELESAAGAASLRGTIDDLSVEADLRLARKQEKQTVAGKIALALILKPAEIDLTELTIAPDATEPDSNGSARIQGKLQRNAVGDIAALDLMLSADQLNPALLLPEFPGAIGASARLTATQLDTKRPSAELAIDTLNGTLKSRPIGGEGKLTFTQSMRPEGALNLAWGNNRITLRPQANADLQSSVDLQELALIEPDARGSVQGDLLLIADSNGRLLGADGALSARLLSLKQLKISELELKIQAPSDANAPIALMLDAVEVQYGDAESASRIDQLTASVAGTRAQHGVTLKLSAPEGQLSLSASGSLTPQTAQSLLWQGTLQSLQLAPETQGKNRALPALTLRTPTALRIGESGLAFDSGCFTDKLGMDFCVQANLPAKGDGSASAVLNKLPLASLFESDASMSGALSGTVQALARDGEWQELEVKLSQLEPISMRIGSIAEGDELGDIKTLHMEELALSLQARRVLGSAWAPQLDASLRLREGLQAELSRVAIAANEQLSGTVSLTIEDLAQFNDISRAIGAISGRVAGQIQLGGTRELPELDGQIKSEGLSIELPQTNIILRDGNLTARAERDRFVIAGTVRSGEGSLALEGAYAPRATNGRFSLTMKGENVLVADLPSARVIASPDLRIRHDGTMLRIDGEVRLPQANLQLDRYISSTTRSADVVVTDAPPESPDAPIRADVAVILGDDVKLKGFGLNGQLKGQVKIRERPNRPSTGRGEIEIVGTYKAYGQDLLIERGKLLFAASPLDDPGLDIRAVRSIEKVKAGVQVRGTARMPELLVWSDPIMEESEALSYVVLGRPLRGASAADGELVNQAANALSAAGGNLLAKGIGQRIGLELGVETLSDIGGPAFTAGKYLSPKLYVGYGQGLFNPQTLFILRYKLFSSYELEALSGREQKIGVNYRKER